MNNTASGQKTDRDALAKNGEDYRRLLEITSQGYIQLDAGYKISDVNKAICNMLGYTREEFIGRSPLEFASGRSIEDYKKQLGIIDKTKHRTYEIIFKSKGGGDVYVIMNASTLYDGDGAFSGSFAIISDITEKRLAGLELKKIRDHARSIVQISPDAIVEIDDKGTILLWNPGAEKIFGWPENEITGKKLSDTIIPARYREAHLKGMEHFVRTGEGLFLNRRIELTALNRIGSEFPVEITITHVKSDSGFLITAFIRNISERKKKDEELRASEKNFRALFDSASDAIIIHDYNGLILEVNRTACERLGYSCETLKGMSMKDIVNHDQRDMVPERIKKIIDTGQHIFESTHLSFDKIAIPVEVNSSLLDFDGAPAILSVSRDITEREKTHEMIIQTEKMTTVGRLAAGMAHEINNPLGIILQGIQVAQGRLDPGNRKNIETARNLGIDMEIITAYMRERKIMEYLEGIREAGKRAANIVSNMLLFSRNSTFRFAAADMNKILDNALDIASKDFDLKKNYDFRNIAIVKKYDYALPLFQCVENEIEQVVLNIFKNSAQAMAERKDRGRAPEISIKTSFSENYIRTDITDNGPGIPADILNRIFEPFYSTKEAGEGTGLGLFVSYFIVTNTHKGLIKAESEPGNYTRITIQLPVLRDKI